MTVTDAAPPAARPARWTAQWKELYAEVITVGPVHGVRRLRHLVPPRRHRLPPRAGRLQAVPPRGRAGPRQLHPRREGLHVVHPRLPPLPGVGASRPTSTCSPAPASPTRCRASTRTSCSRGRATRWCTAWARTAASCRRMLIWAQENDYIDAALVSYLEGDGRSWKAEPGVAASKDEILAAAGSRYTYSANTLALNEALERGHTRLALVGMACQSSVPPIMWNRKAGKVGKPFLFNIGLLCSKTFDDSIFDELFETKYGLAEAGHGQDEHQGRLPDLDEGRPLPRDRPEGVPRLDARGLHPLPGLRRRARRHLDRRHRQGQRLDADHRAHRARPRRSSAG